MNRRMNAVAAVFMLITSAQAFAMGGARVSDTDANDQAKSAGGIAIGEITGSLQLNPYVTALQKEFAEAIKPVSVNPANDRLMIGDNIQLEKRYDCRVFYALTQKNALLPTTSTTWYKFTKYGDLFLDNLAYLDTGKIKTFAANPLIEGELWGQSDDHTVYEALRVTRAGDLIIETFSPESSWTRAIIGVLGLDGNILGLASQIQGLALPAVVAGTNGYVLSYTYCPRDHVSVR